MNPSANSQNTTIGVLIATLSTQLSDTLAQLVGAQPDMRIVGTVSSTIDLLFAVGSDTDVVILGAASATPVPAICTHLLSEYTRLRVIVIGSDDMAGAMAYWLGLRQQPCHAALPTGLLASIRNVYQLDPVE